MMAQHRRSRIDQMQHEIRNSRYWLDAGSRKMVSVQLHEEGAPPNQSEKKGFPLKMRLDLGLPIGAPHDTIELVPGDGI